MILVSTNSGQPNQISINVELVGLFQLLIWPTMYRNRIWKFQWPQNRSGFRKRNTLDPTQKTFYTELSIQVNFECCEDISSKLMPYSHINNPEFYLV